MAQLTFQQFMDKTINRSGLLIRAVSLKTFSSIIKDTPVGNPDLWKSQSGKSLKDRKGPEGYVGGRLRGNWNCSLGAADTSTVEAPDTSGIKGKKAQKAAYRNFPSQAEVLNDVNITIASGDWHNVFWLANSLPYAHTIEYDAHSSQAPAGMVRKNVARIKENISRELSRIKATS